MSSHPLVSLADACLLLGYITELFTSRTDWISESLILLFKYKADSQFLTISFCYCVIPWFVQVVFVAVYILRILQNRRLVNRAEELYMQVTIPLRVSFLLSSYCTSSPALAYLCRCSLDCPSQVHWKSVLAVRICPWQL